MQKETRETVEILSEHEVKVQHVVLWVDLKICYNKILVVCTGMVIAMFVDIEQLFDRFLGSDSSLQGKKKKKKYPALPYNVRKIS